MLIINCKNQFQINSSTNITHNLPITKYFSVKHVVNNLTIIYKKEFIIYINDLCKNKIVILIIVFLIYKV